MYFFGIDVFLLQCVKHVQDSASHTAGDWQEARTSRWRSLFGDQHPSLDVGRDRKAELNSAFRLKGGASLRHSLHRVCAPKGAPEKERSEAVVWRSTA